MYTLDGLAKEVAQTGDGKSAQKLWQVARPRTDDSVTLLDRLSNELKQAQQSLCPIVLSPPRGAFDTGSVALMQMAVGLMENQLADGPLSAKLKDPGSWSTKLAAVKDVLEDKYQNIVLLINEPQTWASLKNDREEPEFGEHADGAVRLVSEVGCRKIVFERRLKPSAASLDIRCGGGAEQLLGDASKWGSLGAFTGSVLTRYGTGLNELSELEIRLLVALAATFEPMPTSLDDPFNYIKRLETFIQRKPTASPLRQIMSKLSMLRGTFADSMLDHLHADRLGQPWLDILKLCILQKTEHGWVLPWILRRVGTRDREAGPSQLSEEENRNRHADIAKCYVEQISMDKSSKEEFQTYLPDMEAFHHAARAANRNLAMGQTVFFSEQLDALGKSLSQAALYDEAVEVFAASLQWDPEDDYAHHYLAFNLDIQGKDRKTAETHYTAAVSYSPAKAWWWSRWICFLITIGRTADAEREWAEAMSALGLHEQDAAGRATIYFHLHSWVLRLLLHRGQLEFAAKVLDDIPASVFDEDAHDTEILGRLKTHLRSLFEARRNRAILPVFIDPDQWWMKRPAESVAEPRLDDKPLQRWFPGRIESIDDGQVYIALGSPPKDGEAESNVRTWIVTRAEFDRLSGATKYDLHAGRFVELAYYGDNTEPRVFVRPEETHGLPPVRPDPARYLLNRWKGV